MSTPERLWRPSGPPRSFPRPPVTLPACWEAWRTSQWSGSRPWARRDSLLEMNACQWPSPSFWGSRRAGKAGWAGGSTTALHSEAVPAGPGSRPRPLRGPPCFPASREGHRRPGERSGRPRGSPEALRGAHQEITIFLNFQIQNLGIQHEPEISKHIYE